MPAPAEAHALEEELRQLRLHLEAALRQNSLPQQALQLQHSESAVTVLVRSAPVCRLEQRGGRLVGLCVDRCHAALLPAGAAEGKARDQQLFFAFEPRRGLQDWLPALARICVKRLEEAPAEASLYSPSRNTAES